MRGVGWRGSSRYHLKCLKEAIRSGDAALCTKLGNRDPVSQWDATGAPVIQALRSEAEMRGNNLAAKLVDQVAIEVFCVCHAQALHGACMTCKDLLLFAPSKVVRSYTPMETLSDRIRIRLAEIGMTQVQLARASGLSTARLGNYVQGTRPPDINSLAKIARALQTSTDWLLGLSEVRPAEVKPVLLRLLQLDGMPEGRAQVLAEAASTALRLLSTFPDEGDDQTRAHLAAQAAWQTKLDPKLH